LTPVEAVRLASYNTAQYFRLYDRGAIAPNFVADFVVLDDLNTFEVESVYKDGKLVAQGGKLLVDVPAVTFRGVTGTVHIGNISAKDLRIPGKPGLIKVIGIEPDRLQQSTFGKRLR